MIRDRIKELRRVRASELLPNPKNWRRHPDHQAAAMSEMLNQVGYADALIARETPEGLMLIDGHLRAETTPDAEVPVLVLDIDEAEADVLLATLDPLAAMAQADQDSLLDLLDGLEAGGSAVGAMLEALANGSYESLAPMPFPQVTPEADEDNTAEALDQVEADDYVPFTEPGQVWQLGDHRLMCGDATKREDVGLLMHDHKAQLVLTDPPYGVAYRSPKKSAISGDLTQAAIPVSFSVAVDDATDDNARFYWWGGSENMAMYASLFNHHFYQQPRLLVWVKNSFILRHNNYHSRFELLYFGWKGSGGGSQFWYSDRKQDDIWESSRDLAPEHPTQKPVNLCERAIANSADEGDIVYDSFVGSGTTIIAAEKLGRRCYAMEIEPRYCDVAIRRWQAYTGRKAELVSP